jgi:hypothetical protein
MIKEMTNQITPKNKSYAPFLVGAFMTLAITGLIYLSSNLKTVAARSVALAVAGALILPAINAFQVQLEDEQDQPVSALDHYSSRIIDEYMLELLRPTPIRARVETTDTTRKSINYGDVRLESEEDDVIDVVFEEGISWEALNESIDKVKVEDGTSELSIKAIEKRGNELIVKVFSSNKEEKEKIQNKLLEYYKTAVTEIEQKYGEQINNFAAQNSSLLGIVDSMSKAESSYIDNRGHSQTVINVEGDFVIKSSGSNIGLEKISELVEDQISRISNNSPEKLNIKSTLLELANQIESEPNLSNEEKVLALGQLKAIADATSNPKDTEMQHVAKNALMVLSASAKELPSTTKVAEKLKDLMPILAKLLNT